MFKFQTDTSKESIPISRNRFRLEFRIAKANSNRGELSVNSDKSPL
jgi:ribosomal protein S30